MIRCHRNVKTIKCNRRTPSQNAQLTRCVLQPQCPTSSAGSLWETWQADRVFPLARAGSGDEIEVVFFLFLSSSAESCGLTGTRKEGSGVGGFACVYRTAYCTECEMSVPLKTWCETLNSDEDREQFLWNQSVMQRQLICLNSASIKETEKNAAA